MSYFLQLVTFAPTAVSPTLLRNYYHYLLALLLIAVIIATVIIATVIIAIILVSTISSIVITVLISANTNM